MTSQSRPGVKKVYCKGPESKYIRLCFHMVSVTIIPLCRSSPKVSTDKMKIDSHDCVPIKLYVDTEM